MTVAADWGQGDAFLSILWFFLFIIWLWLLIIVFSDIFRSDDLSGWGKALWTIFVIVLPYLGVFVYLIARGHKMSEHAQRDVQAQDDAMRNYIRSVSSGGGGVAAEISRLADLRDRGLISEEEFQAAKAKALSA